MALTIHRIVNNPVTSNCYIIYNNDNGNNCLIIDPGSEDSSAIDIFFKDYNLIPEYIILTHEHFDHVWGINNLREDYPNIKLVCSAFCSEAIGNRKKNFSLFYNQRGFEVASSDITIENFNYLLRWNDETISFIETKGHSQASVCILINNILFSGDTMILGEKTVTKLKGGDIVELRNSIEQLSLLFKQLNPIVYPGHGEKFLFNEYLF